MNDSERMVACYDEVKSALIKTLADFLPALAKKYHLPESKIQPAVMRAAAGTVCQLAYQSGLDEVAASALEHHIMLMVHGAMQHSLDHGTSHE